eukprot:1127251-Amphidinium_carterae.1
MFSVQRGQHHPYGVTKSSHPIMLTRRQAHTIFTNGRKKSLMIAPDVLVQSKAGAPGAPLLNNNAPATSAQNLCRNGSAATALSGEVGSKSLPRSFTVPSLDSA